MMKRIEFLPFDITSLQIKLAYLLDKYQTSNTPATRNEIVAITDNLLKRKHISTFEYTKINDYISHQGTMHHCNQCSKLLPVREMFEDIKRTHAIRAEMDCACLKRDMD